MCLSLDSDSPSSYNEYQAWEVIEHQQRRVVASVQGGDWQTVLEGDVAALAWNLIDTPTLVIVLRDGSLYTATAPTFHPQMMGYMESVNRIWFTLP